MEDVVDIRNLWSTLEMSRSIFYRALSIITLLLRVNTLFTVIKAPTEDFRLEVADCVSDELELFVRDDCALLTSWRPNAAVTSPTQRVRDSIRDGQTAFVQRGADGAAVN